MHADARNILALWLTLVMCAVALADGALIAPWPPIPRPVERLTPMAVKSHRVEVQITDQFAVTKIDQVFHNPNNRDLEGLFIFPLPAEAAVSDFSMFVDGKELKGELLDKEKARQIYEDIVRQKKDPALLEYLGTRMFQARIFPIPANGDKRVKLSYSEPLNMDAGLCTYRYPLNTEKFSSRPLQDVAVVIDLRSQRPIRSVFSPSHKMDVILKDEHNARASFEAKNVTPDQDVVLYYTVSEKAFGLNLVTFCQKGEDGYFLAMLAPRHEVPQEEKQKKDIIFVCDTSGSMKGENMEQARNALMFCLKSLNPGDRFNIVDFSTTARTFRDKLVEADKQNVEAALEYVKKLEAVGGTAINEALTVACSMGGSEERPFMILFLTDGKPTIGPDDPLQILNNVKKAAKGKLRIFTFGVGHDVNTHLLDRLAEQYRGARTYVVPGENIEHKVSSLYTKIAHPALSDVAVTFEDIKTYDVFPRAMPDLFRGGQLEVVGRYSGSGVKAVRLSGMYGNQRTVYVYEGKFAEEDSSHEFLPRLWATRKIAYLLDEMRLHGEKKELKDEVIALSKKFGVMTPYTSFLVLEDEARKPVAQRMLPEALAKAPERAARMREAWNGFRKESGAGGVQSSVDVRLMAEAPATAAAPADFLGRDAREIVRHVGPMTFYFRDGKWVISTYQPGQKTIEVKYLSDEYFELARKSKDIAAAFALGERVIVMHEGKTYEVIP